ncbi:global nitrogen regulator NtcA [compost metagenome]
MSGATVKGFTIPSLEDRRRFLLGNSLFCNLPEDVLDALVDMARIRQLKDRACLHAKGHMPDGMYAVLQGCIRATSCLPNGKEVLLSLIEPGSWLGESSLFDGLPRAYDAYAQGDCTLLQLPKDGLDRLLEERPELYRFFVQLLCQRVRLSLLLLEANALLPLEGRLAGRLLLLAEQGCATRTTLRVSQEDLSQMLGTSRQSINKVLKTWEQIGLISRHYGRITLSNREALRQLASTE